MAAEVGLTQTAVSRIWRAFGLQPHRQETWKLSKDPLFIEKVRDVVGLYLESARAGRRAVRGREEPDPGAGPHRADPADAARHPRARDPRLQAARHLQPLRRAGHHHRQGDRLAARAPPRDRVQEVPADHRPRGPRRARRAPDARQRLHPQDPGDPALARSRTPGSSCTSPRPARSWLNLVERWFAELTTKKLRRGAHRSVRALNTDIRALDRHLERRTHAPTSGPRPPTKSSTPSARYCKRINDSRH